MIKKLLLLTLLTPSLFATSGFIPYDSGNLFAFDTRLEGNFDRHKKFYEDMKERITWHGDAYITSESGYFLRGGFILNRFRDVCITDVRPNVQVGAYWFGIGAIRFGVFQGGPGAAVDYWLSYDRLQWLTSLEVFGYKIDDDIRHFWRGDMDSQPFVRWLNRIFLTDNLYFSFGAIHWHGTTGFAGLGYAF